MRTTHILKRITLAYSLLYSMSSFAQMEVHEWGTFTSLVGSDGITQDGMYHEDEPLPNFVHGFGETLPLETAAPPPTTAPNPRPRPPCHNKGCFMNETFASNVVTQKMETPVIYFYSVAKTKQRVEVNVRFPEGVITETFPAPVESSPSSQTDLVIKNGQAKFVVDVLPTLFDKLPETSQGNIYEHARFTHSNIVHSVDNREIEKFIFYRGLGRFQPKVAIRSENGSLHFEAKYEDMPQKIFLVDVNNNGDSQMLEVIQHVDHMGIRATANVSFNDIVDLRFHMRHHTSGILVGDEVKKALISSLTTAGLFQDEAEAMINTWENGYLKVPGLRLLYILPRNEVDSVLPLSLSPAPDKLVRAFVGRIEIMLDTEEAQLLKDISSLRLKLDVDNLGRFAESKLRRISQVAATVRPELVPVIQNLLKRTQPFAAPAPESSPSTAVH
jgi:hypothetical protein